LINAIERFVEDDTMTYGAAIAFQMFFSFFAFVIFLIALLGFFHIPNFFDPACGTGGNCAAWAGCMDSRISNKADARAIQ